MSIVWTVVKTYLYFGVAWLLFVNIWNLIVGLRIMKEYRNPIDVYSYLAQKFEMPRLSDNDTKNVLAWALIIIFSLLYNILCWPWESKRYMKHPYRFFEDTDEKKRED